MTFQGVFPARGEIPQLVEIIGSALVGTKLKAPLGVMSEVYVLPMESVKDTKVSASFRCAPVLETRAVGYRRCHLRPVRFPRRLHHDLGSPQKSRLLQS